MSSTPAKRGTGSAEWLVDVVRHRLLQQIPGSRLPNRAELARRFRVSTRAVRRAMEILAGEGLVQSTARGGMYVLEQANAPSPIRRVMAVPLRYDWPVPHLEQILHGIDLQCARYRLKFEVYRKPVDLADPDCLTCTCTGDLTKVGWLFVNQVPSEQCLLAWTIRGLRVALVDTVEARCRTHTINCDSQYAAYQATEKVILLGHRRIVYLGPQPAGSLVGARRREGFELAHAHHGLTVSPNAFWNDPGDSSERTRQVVRDGIGQSRPTAIVGGNQKFGCIALSVCDEAGLRVPQDISVISCGLSRRDLPPVVTRLSCIDEGEPEALGRMAADVLFNVPPGSTAVSLLAGVTWRDRGSIGPPRE
ncbi:MAG: substrate-binding domain-containing protein [Phycisphaerae bacterium]|nr:substrate-binding domain-containing protein [Phycisphaerae bacterium]